MDKNKIAKENFKIIEAGLFAKKGIEIVGDLIYTRDLPNAIICFNDQVAMGAIQTLKGNGLRVPEDVAIMGHTETRMAELITPRLSSVYQPTYEMGIKTVELLLKLIHDVPEQPETVLLNGVLNVRESSIRDKSVEF